MFLFLGFKTIDFHTTLTKQVSKMHIYLNCIEKLTLLVLIVEGSVRLFMANFWWLKFRRYLICFFSVSKKKNIFFWNNDSFIVFWTNYNTVTLQLSLFIIISHNFDMILLNVALLLLCFAVHTLTLPCYQSKTKHFNLYLTFNLQHLIISFYSSIFNLNPQSLANIIQPSICKLNLAYSDPLNNFFYSSKLFFKASTAHLPLSASNSQSAIQFLSSSSWSLQIKLSIFNL